MSFPVPVPFSLLALPFLILTLILQILIFWLMTKHKGINLLRSTIGVSLANLITWFLGLFVMLGSSLTSNLYAYFAMFFITVIIDSAFYNAFYSKRQISKLYMILVAFLTSLISYLIIGYGIFLHTGFAEKYLHLLGIQVV